MPTSAAQQQASATWQKTLANAVKCPRQLLESLGLNNHPAIDKPEFPLRVPQGFIARMEYGNPNDPLLLQVLPQPQEHIKYAGFSLDPVGDLASVRNNGLLQKYHGRVLIMATGACAIHCRYCFRRHFPYSEHSSRPQNWAPLVEQIADDPQISEVILSGGDPLLLNDTHLATLVQMLEQIPHVRRLRIHSRLPIVLPERITPSLATTLTSGSLTTVMVIHCNHANEIDEHVSASLDMLKQHGMTLLNQAVLLKGINDSAQAQIKLNEKLFDTGVLPYYLHMLDQVEGAGHFEVEQSHALALMDEMMRSLPGYLVPKLVRECTGDLYKTPVKR